jgi:hypothetical protein
MLNVSRNNPLGKTQSILKWIQFLRRSLLLPFWIRRDSSVSIVKDWNTGVRFPAGKRSFSPLYSDQGGSGVHPDSYLMNTVGSFQVVTLPGLSLSTHLNLMPRIRMCGSIHPLPHTSSRRGASLFEQRENFAFCLHRVCLKMSCLKCWELFSRSSNVPPSRDLKFQYHGYESPRHV